MCYISGEDHAEMHEVSEEDSSLVDESEDHEVR